MKIKTRLNEFIGRFGKVGHDSPVLVKKVWGCDSNLYLA